MEQLTWPRGSGGHIFSTISASDYGEFNWRHRKDSSHPRHCQSEASASSRQTKSSRDYNLSDYNHHISLNEEASGHGVDQLACGPLRFPIKKDDDDGKLEFTDINQSKACMVFTPHTPLWCESNPSSNARNYSVRSTNHTHGVPDFAMLPDDILLRVMGSFSWKDLWSASRVCRSWCLALAPLREAMHFVHWGKRFKHGRGGIARNVDKALLSFLNGAKRGCTAAMVDAGLLLWEMGQKQEGVHWYKQAAELGDPAGQCNLGLAFLQNPNNAAEAVKWFQRAALAGHVRAQYSLALCLQQGRGVDSSIVKAARWYQRAADGGSARAMYNLALCYTKGEGLIRDSQYAKKWMKRAALAGHRKAQYEHGLTLFASVRISTMRIRSAYTLYRVDLASRRFEYEASP
ncbi:hypothetical protein GOP47_0023664 [Adiantum capillus-veneris]|uniref:F-box domain-containing protein n=1 Tax=Adiantum capillus-veneris TaxID=13818 RepID=A0A9D4U635_ADICA|nr:hypothetical protein GOP47_0023659 [Adiantum capillus-veneris]KAI5061159.1 hypothetical protein GOP47_0023664 [Adiantum capillus-veneris]